MRSDSILLWGPALFAWCVVAFWFSWPLWVNRSGAAEHKGHDKPKVWGDK